MKRFAALGFAALLSAACGTESTTPIGGGSDAGVGPDASGADAAVTDSGPAPDAGLEPVEFTVFQQGAPLGGVAVLMHDVEGSLIGETTTSSAGPLTLDLPPDAMISVVATAPGAGGNLAYISYTYGGVQPGDQIALGGRTTNPPDRTTDLQTIQVDIDEPPAGTAGVLVSNGCQSLTVTTTTAITVDIDFAAACLTARDDFNVIATAADETGRVLGHAQATAVAIPPATPSVAVSLGAWSEQTRAFDVRMISPRPRTLFVSTELTVLADGLGYGVGSVGTPVLGVGAAISASLPARFGSGLLYQVNTIFGEGQSLDGLTASGWVRRSALPPEAMLDLTQDSLPPIYGADVDQTDSARPTVRWRIDQEVIGADALYVAMNWSDPGRDHTWTFILPPTRTAPLRFPEMPPAFVDFLPTPTSDLSNRQVYLLDQSYIDGWDDLRNNHGFDAFGLPPPEVGDSTYRFSLGGNLPF